MKRREFLGSASLGLIAPAILASSTARVERTRIGVIGHTGRGDYGHGLDTVWLELDGMEIVGVADADADGLAKAKTRLGVERGFADYREMLRVLRPEIVSICPRHADQHRDMAVAAIEAGARGVYIEKPFCRTPREADAILAAAKEHGVRIAVAHRTRYHPVISTIDELIASGRLGRILELRGRGKSDRRGGAEDLWVLGTHVLNLVHHFGGHPRRCSAVLLEKGEPVTKADVYDGAEGLGPLAGDELHARFEMEKGFVAYFDSLENDGAQNQGFGLMVIGSLASVWVQCDRSPLAYLIDGNPFRPRVETGGAPWVPISSAGPGRPEPREDLEKEVFEHRIPARDLLRAVREGNDPVCDGREAAMTVEMVSAVFESHRQEGRAVSLPLAERGAPLASL
jgi:predicted dehydrogenase